MNNAASLSKLKKDELVELCKQHGISGYSKLKKDELVALLTETMGSGAAAAAPSAEPAEPAAPAEKSAALKKDSAEKEPLPGNPLTRYCIALTNLWGIAPVSMIAAVYNQHTGASVTAEEVEAAAPTPAVDGELIHARLSGKTARIEELRQRQAHYSHYVPSATHMADYLDENFRETTHAFHAMCDFLTRTFQLREAIAIADALQILQYLESGSDVDAFMRQLAATGIRFDSEDQLRSFAFLLGNLKSVSRFWSFCGHTPEEAANFEAKKGPVHVQKVGRNDPCPCGSGKKYKKCCGR